VACRRGDLRPSDRLRHEGFIAGYGADGYRANVRSAIKRIRNKFRALARLPELNFYTEPALAPQSGNSKRRPRPGTGRLGREPS
jgi:hypothetical protein